jgi:5-methylcytosine-specific restriction endonuclease McrA
MPELDTHYERIDRIWLNETNRLRLADCIKNRGFNWVHGDFDWFKVILKKRLRQRQQHRCCYCRRVLRYDKGVVEIEHIVDKGSNNGEYKRFTFEIKNLALSCKDCNNAKGIKKVLVSPLKKAAPYPKRAADFTWVHPHFHKYSEHIIIHQGWVYEARDGSKEGLAVIKNCFLDDLAKKELQNRKLTVDGATDLKDAICRAIGVVGDVGLDALCQEVGKTLAKKWNSTHKEIEENIRAVYLALQQVSIKP